MTDLAGRNGISPLSRGSLPSDEPPFSAGESQQDLFQRKLGPSLGLRMLATALGVLAAGCGGGERPTQGTARAASLVASDQSTPTPIDSTVDSEVDASSETALMPFRDVEVAAGLDGEIVGVDVEEGQRVVAGNRLAQLDDRELRATLDEREAELARAEAAWINARQLQGEAVISEEQSLATQVAWKVSRAQCDRARIAWERCAVRAPISGIVARRCVQVGETVKQGEVLFRLSDPDTLRAELLLPEVRLGTVQVGQHVTVTPTAGGTPVRSRIARVNPLVDPGSGMFRVVVYLDNRSGRIKSGVSAHVAFDSIRSAER